MLLVLLAAAALFAGARSLAAYGFAGYVFAMLINVFAPHVVASIVLHRYMPGLATALIFNLPLAVLFLRRALADGFVVWGTLIWAAPLVALLVLLSIPVLFALGRMCMPNRA